MTPDSRKPDHKANAARRELILILFAGTILWVLASVFGLFRPLEQLEKTGTSIDELLILLFFAAVALGLFSFRRWSELREEINRRRRTEEQLDKTEQRYRHLVEASAEATTVASEGKIVFANAAAAKLMGAAGPEQLIGESALAFIHPEYHENATTRDPLLMSEGVTTPPSEEKLVRVDGAVVDVEIALASLIYEGKRSAQATFHDITERKRAERALWETTEKFRVAFEDAPIAMGLADAGGNFLQVNRAQCEMLGYSEQEFLGTNFEAISHPDDLRENFDYRGKVSSGEIDSYRMEKRYVHKDGHAVWGLLNTSVVRDGAGNPLFFIGHIQDITGRKRAEERRRLAQELSGALSEINAAISSTLDFDEIMQRVIVGAAKAVGCEAAVVDMRDGDHWVVKYVYGRLPKKLVGARLTKEKARAAEAAAEARKPVVIEDARGDERFRSEVVETYDIASALAVPLISRGEVIGCLIFTYHSAKVEFTQAQVDFASKLAASLSLALENARLYGAERDISHTLQEALLNLPPKVAGIEYGSLYHSATEAARVGGDFFDLFELDKGRVGIVMGDVSGKGIQAATVTTLVKYAIKAYATEGHTPSSTLAKTNEVLINESLSATFVTVFFGILDTATGVLTYCSAGHPPGVLKRKSSQPAFLDGRSPVLGALSDLEYADASESLSDGDMLLLYTDGVTEARREGDLFGEERLMSLFASLDGHPVEELPQSVFDQILDFTGGTLKDDLALLAVSVGADPLV